MHRMHLPPGEIGFEAARRLDGRLVVYRLATEYKGECSAIVRTVLNNQVA